MRIFIAILVTVLLGSQTPVLNNSTPTQLETVETVQQVTEPTVAEIPNETTAVVETPATVVEQETPVYSHEELLRAVGIPEDQWYAVDYILTKESNWCHTRWQGIYGACPDTYIEKFSGAENDKSLGYGLCQSTPAIKMETAGSDWRTNAITQLRWCNDYAIARYGSWHGAYSAWINQRWW